MALGPQDHSTIQSLKREYVAETLRDSQKFTATKKWVGSHNRYVVDTIKRIEVELATGSVTRPRQLAQYIAASPVLHCTDGWSYLGKAISCLLRGDPHRARHLAYYAELRAAMSLLATSGVGVFNNRHFVIDAPNSVAKLQDRSGTHGFVWSCLEYWCTQSASGDMFASVIRPHGRTLDDWLMPLGGGHRVAAQAKDWFLQWGMDLALPAEDKDARNESSYRPDGMLGSWCLDAATTLEFTRDVWLALEPSYPSRFGEIDRHILRLALESIFHGQIGIPPAKDRKGFRKFVSGVVRYQSFTQELTEEWMRFLCRRISPTNLSVLKFSKVSPGTKKNSHAAIVARAALLLRVASGSTADLLRDAGFTPPSMAFWWEGIGQSRGLWDGAMDAGDLLDLWADIQLLLDDIDTFQGAHNREDQTFFRLGSELGEALVGLGSCERVAIWSLIPG